jgi:ACR3 family arsenite efflux pump ArsB
MGMLLGEMGGMSFMGVLLMPILRSSVGVWGMIWPVLVEVGVVRMGTGFGNGIAVVRVSLAMGARIVPCLVLVLAE